LFHLIPLLRQFRQRNQICKSRPCTKQITASSTSRPPFGRHIGFHSYQIWWWPNTWFH